MGPLLLIITTLIWGTAFLAQKIGADSIGPFVLTCFRNVLGGGFLAVCILVRNRFLHTSTSQLPNLSTSQPPNFSTSQPLNLSTSQPLNLSTSIRYGVYSGIPLFAAMVTQQVGIEYTTPGVSAFLTTNYILFVPVIAALLARKLPHWHVWLGAAIALTGTYFICVTGEKIGLGRGEAWTILCALLFSVQMIVVDRFAPQCDVLVMSASQLFTAAAVGVPFLFLPGEVTRLGSVFTLPALTVLFYCGVVSSGIAYTLQNFGQAKCPAALAAILLSLEAVFGALAGYVFRGDVMTPLQLFGCFLVFLAAVVSQVLACGGQSKA